MIETQLLPNFIEFITNFKYQGKNISLARNVFYLYIRSEIFLSFYRIPGPRSAFDTYGYFQQLREIMDIGGNFAKTIKPFIAQMNFAEKSNKRKTFVA